jgi:predicted ArsR family transcriptional regulator
MPRRAHDFRGLTQPRRLRLLRHIQLHPGHTAAALAQECDMPLNTARDHLRVLEEEGLIVSETRRAGTRGRPPVVFRPVIDPTVNAIANARVKGAAFRGRMLRAVSDDPSAGLDAAAQRQVDVLYEHLDDAGLQPRIDASALIFDLTPCRYHRLIDEDQDLVCGAHARLVADVLRQAGGPLRIQHLDPFVSTHRCRLALTGDEDGTEALR